MDLRVIAYDLHDAIESDYETLIDAIKRECPNNFEIQKSVWVVGSSKSTSDIRDALSPRLPHRGNEKDKLFVAPLPTGSSWVHIPDLLQFIEKVRAK